MEVNKLTSHKVLNTMWMWGALNIQEKSLTILLTLQLFLKVSRNNSAVHFVVVVQPLYYVQVSSTPWTAARQISLSFTISRSLLKLTSVESMMPSAIHKEIQTKFFITASPVVATTLEITGRIRKRKHEINPSIHILWIISHLWKTHESHQCSLTWKHIHMSLNGLKRKASCWVMSVIWSPHLFFF